MLQGMCEVKTNDLLLSNSLFKNEVSTVCAPSSNPTKGSSKIIKSELLRNTLYKANFFCCPNDKLDTVTSLYLLSSNLSR